MIIAVLSPLFCTVPPFSIHITKDCTWSSGGGASHLLWGGSNVWELYMHHLWSFRCIYCCVPRVRADTGGMDEWGSRAGLWSAVFFLSCLPSSLCCWSIYVTRWGWLCLQADLLVCGQGCVCEWERETERSPHWALHPGLRGLKIQSELERKAAAA